MIISVDSLRRDTMALIREIDAELEELKKKQANEADRLGTSATVDGDALRRAALLQGKATAYNTLVMLQSGDNRPGRGRTRS